ncbi:MAG TPA: hypothetical protein VF881_03850, partial [Polyangiaceae bacterium]
RTKVGGQETNVFTIFGPLIMDYTLVGSTLVFLIVGVVAGFGYGRVMNGNLVSIPILLIFYINALIMGGWFFTYNAVTASHFIIGFYLLWMQSQLRGRDERLPVGTSPPIQVPCQGQATFSVDIPAGK